MNLQFPSALAAYDHLELTRPVRLSGPRAAQVQMQLEAIAGTDFAGAKAPLRRRPIKSPDVLLQEFPLAPAEGSTCRSQILGTFGLDEASLAALVKIERDVVEAKEERRRNRPSAGANANHLGQDEEEEYGDLFDGDF